MSIDTIKKGNRIIERLLSVSQLVKLQIAGEGAIGGLEPNESAMIATEFESKFLNDVMELYEKVFEDARARIRAAGELR